MSAIAGGLGNVVRQRMQAAGSAAGNAASTGGANEPPAWAKRMRRAQRLSHGTHAALHAVRSGDSHGGGASIQIGEGNP